MVSIKLKGLGSAAQFLLQQVLRGPRAGFGKTVVASLEITRLQLDQLTQMCTCDLGTQMSSHLPGAR